MSTPYNLSFMDGSSSLLVVAQGVNDGFGGLFGALLLLILFIVLLVVFLSGGADFRRAFVGDSFLCSVVAGFFLVAELIPGWVLLLPILFLVGGLFALVFGE